MSDIYCKCGEPWDLDSLHDLIAEREDERQWRPKGKFDDKKYRVLFNRYRTEFRRKGCELFGTSHSNCNPSAGNTFAAIDEIMGDDVDGAIAMMEDAEQMGLF